jgi:hypothetical protein
MFKAVCFGHLACGLLSVKALVEYPKGIVVLWCGLDLPWHVIIGIITFLFIIVFLFLSFSGFSW